MHPARASRRQARVCSVVASAWVQVSSPGGKTHTSVASLKRDLGVTRESTAAEDAAAAAGSGSATTTTTKATKAPKAQQSKQHERMYRKEAVRAPNADEQALLEAIERVSKATVNAEEKVIVKCFGARRTWTIKRVWTIKRKGAHMGEPSRTLTISCEAHKGRFDSKDKVMIELGLITKEKVGKAGGGTAGGGGRKRPAPVSKGKGKAKARKAADPSYGSDDGEEEEESGAEEGSDEEEEPRGTTVSLLDNDDDDDDDFGGASFVQVADPDATEVADPDATDDDDDDGTGGEARGVASVPPHDDMTLSSHFIEPLD
jgi:hypothetical protein